MVIAFRKDTFTHKLAVQLTWDVKQTLKRSESDEAIKVYNDIERYCADSPTDIEKEYWVADIRETGVTFIN